MYFGRICGLRGGRGNSLPRFSLGASILKLFLPFKHDSRDRDIDLANHITARLDQGSQVSTKVRPRAHRQIGIFVDYFFSNFQISGCCAFVRLLFDCAVADSFIIGTLIFAKN
jgi:hypothetical protein